MGQLRFVAHEVAAGTYSVGAALGELTDAVDKAFRDEFNSIGSGEFHINKHSPQAEWCATGNFVKVYLDDISADGLIGGFWLEEGEDTLLSEQEQGGEYLHRGGPGPLHYLHNAVLYHTTFTNNDSALPSPDTNMWHWVDRPPGALLVRQLEEAIARGALPDLAGGWDFTRTTDSDGTPWAIEDADYAFPVGMDYLTFVSELIKVGLIVKMVVNYGDSAGFQLLAWESFGTDHTADVVLRKGDGNPDAPDGTHVYIREAAERQVHATVAKSRALIQGINAAGKLVWREVISAATEAEIGHREGFAGAIQSAKATTLDAYANRYLRSTKEQYDGPTSVGLVERSGDPRAFIDYVPGDAVTVDIPGEFDTFETVVQAITLVDTKTGEYDPIVTFLAIPFDPNAAVPGSTTGPGGSGGGKTCGDCPDRNDGPFVPPAVTGCAIVQDHFTNALFGGAEQGGGNITLPAAVTAGNMLVIGFSSRDGDDAEPCYPDTGSGTNPAGFTSPEGNRSTGNVSSQQWFYKVADGDEQHIVMVGSSIGWIYYAELPAATFVDSSTLSGTISAGGGAWVGNSVSGGTITLGGLVSETSDVHIASQAWGAGWTELLDASAATSPFFGPSFSVAHAGSGSISPNGVETIDGGGTHAYNSQALTFLCQADPSAAPHVNQWTCEEITGDGCEDAFTTNYPYVPGSTSFKAGGISQVVTETDPTTGAFTTTVILASGVKGVICYQVADPLAPAGTNPQPSGTSNTTVPPQLLGSGSTGSGTNVLHDDGTWGPVTVGSLVGVTITDPAEDDTLRYVGGMWVNDDRRWEPVTTNPGTGPELVWDGDDIVMTWRSY